MKLATVRCPNPSCGLLYDVALDPGEWHATCPDCLQVNRVPGKDASNEIKGICDRCNRPLDDLHLFGRQPANICCPPEYLFNGGKK
jgi:hypothetical protein